MRPCRALRPLWLLFFQRRIPAVGGFFWLLGSQDFSMFRQQELPLAQRVYSKSVCIIYTISILYSYTYIYIAILYSYIYRIYYIDCRIIPRVRSCNVVATAVTTWGLGMRWLETTPQRTKRRPLRRAVHRRGWKRCADIGLWSRFFH